MSNQTEVFLKSEADQWFIRNKEAILAKDAETDKLTQMVRQADLKPKKVLEIGCANGYRLNFLKQLFHCECYGTDPSQAAIADGGQRYSGLNLQVGTADQLHFANEQFDLIIFGFLLYLCDRSKLFQIASEADRVLQDQGNILIYDFYSQTPYKNDYSHLSGVYSYKMENASMFLWNPNYILFHSQLYSADGSSWKNEIDNTTAIQVVRKMAQAGFPKNPYKE